jgi:hypothetical protein
LTIISLKNRLATAVLPNVKNDFGKLANNTYRHIDKTFNGVLFYFTRKGALVNGWVYKNGRIIHKTVVAANRVGTPSQVSQFKPKIRAVKNFRILFKTQVLRSITSLETKMGV